MSKNDFETPEPKPWGGPSGIARDSVWLTQEDLPHDKDTILAVVQVNRRDNVKFQTGKPKAVMLSLVFRTDKGKVLDRELGLNATNRKVMSKLYGSKCAGWIGKRVALFVQTVNSPQGEVPAVRIRAKELPPDASVQDAPVDNPLTTDAPPKPTPDELRDLTT
jgi:hypothetical protein